MRRLTIALLLAAACAPHESASTHQLCTQNSTDPCCPGSPIILDLAGDGVHLTAPGEGAPFRLRPPSVERWSWTQPGSDDAFLALDRDGDGAIGDGSELFGDGSPQAASASPNGFMALAVLDWPDHGGNDDGVVDARDAAWPQLLLWRDLDHDGRSGAGELSGLDASGVHGFSLDIQPSDRVDEYGNEFRFEASVLADPPASTTASDVWLRRDFTPERTYSTFHCYAWAYTWTVAPPKAACTNPRTVNQPIIYTYLGGIGYVYLREVVFDAESTNIGLAISDASYSVKNAYLPDCEMSPFPAPDPQADPAYNVYGAPASATSSGTPRVKCFEHVHTGGGGC